MRALIIGIVLMFVVALAPEAHAQVFYEKPPPGAAQDQYGSAQDQYGSDPHPYDPNDEAIICRVNDSEGNEVSVYRGPTASEEAAAESSRIDGTVVCIGPFLNVGEDAVDDAEQTDAALDGAAEQRPPRGSVLPVANAAPAADGDSGLSSDLPTATGETGTLAEPGLAQTAPAEEAAPTPTERPAVPDGGAPYSGNGHHNGGGSAQVPDDTRLTRTPADNVTDAAPEETAQHTVGQPADNATDAAPEEAARPAVNRPGEQDSAGAPSTHKDSSEKAQELESGGSSDESGPYQSSYPEGDSDGVNSDRSGSAEDRSSGGGSTKGGPTEEQSKGVEMEAGSTLREGHSGDEAAEDGNASESAEERTRPSTIEELPETAGGLGLGGILIPAAAALIVSGLLVAVRRRRG